MFVYTFQWTLSEFYFNFQISEKYPSQKTQAKKIPHFTMQFFSKNLTNFTNLNSLNIEINMLRQYSQKPFWIYKFSSTHASGVRKNIYIAPFLDAQGLHSWSTLIANVCIFLYIFARKFLFQRRSKVLSNGGGLGGTGLIISLSGSLFGPPKVFHNFSF